MNALICNQTRSSLEYFLTWNKVHMYIKEVYVLGWIHLLPLFKCWASSNTKLNGNRWDESRCLLLTKCQKMSWYSSVCCCSVAQSWPTLCDTMDCSMPGFPVLNYPRACSNSCPLSQWCHPIILPPIVPFSSWLLCFPASGSFPVSQFFTSGGQSIGASASASVFPMNI